MSKKEKVSFGMRVRKVTAYGVSRVIGDWHLVFKSAADAAAYTEGYLNSKLKGEPIEQVIADRHQTTEAFQEQVAGFVKSVSRFRRPKVTSPDALATDVTNESVMV